MYIVGICKPLLVEDIEEIKKWIPFKLPDDYLSFLQTYGYGNINDLLLVELPDEDFLYNPDYISKSLF